MLNKSVIVMHELEYDQIKYLRLDRPGHILWNQWIQLQNTVNDYRGVSMHHEQEFIGQDRKYICV